MESRSVGGGAVVDILILFGPCQFLGSYFRLFLFCYLLGLSIGSRVCTCQCICEDCVGQSRSISICWPLTLVELDGKTKPEKKEKKRGRELCVIQQMGKKKNKEIFLLMCPFLYYLVFKWSAQKIEERGPLWSKQIFPLLRVISYDVMHSHKVFDDEIGGSWSGKSSTVYIRNSILNRDCSKRMSQLSAGLFCWLFSVCVPWIILFSIQSWFILLSSWIEWYK